jgi:GNAT superfamily N-acetyltransferase
VSAAIYALELVEGLNVEAVGEVRRIYEEGFPARLRADFTALAHRPEDGEAALALVRGRHPCGFAMLRRLGGTGWTFLRYFVVDQRLRGQGLGGTMWDKLISRLRADGSTLLVFDVEDPAEPGCEQAEARVRSRRIGFYQSHGARLLPVHGYQTPHGTDGHTSWTPMLLMAAPVTEGLTVPGAEDAPAIVSAVYQHRWGLEPGHPRVAATQIAGAGIYPAGIPGSGNEEGS